MTIGALPILAAAQWDVWVGLLDILVLLTMALLLGTLAERLGQSVIVGYLIAGTLVGPNVMGWISTQRELFNIAELGVALLLFGIGLEFSPRRLLSLRSVVLKAGPLQVALTAVLGFAVAFACGLGAREAVVVGMMVSLSSTACVFRLFNDRAEVDSEHARTAIGILLVQDAAVVPMMLLVNVMATGETWGLIIGRLALALVLSALLVALFFVLFNIVAPRLMLLPTLRRNRDLPILLAVIMATGSAWATHALNLSPALGAFAAGVLLAVSPFSIQIRADIRPLTTLMVTFFFASIGMFGDPVWLIGHWEIVVGIVLAIIVGKTFLTALLTWTFGQPWRYAIGGALCLAQVGEFSFVLAATAQSHIEEVALMSPATFRAMVSATIATLLLTPYLVAVAPWAGARFEQILKKWRRKKPAADSKTDAGVDETDTEDADAAQHAELNLILIIGFGPAGQRVAEGLMNLPHRQIVAVDLNPDNIEIARRNGWVAHLGDATQRDVIEQAGIYSAQAVVITLPHHATTRHLIHLVRDLAPNTFIVARCRYHFLHWELLLAGAHEVVDEEDQLGRRLAAQVRQLVGGSEDA